MGALGAAQAQKPIRHDAAFEKGIELVFDKLRQAAATLGTVMSFAVYVVLVRGKNRLPQ